MTHRTQSLGLPYLALAALALGVGALIGMAASLCHGWPGQFYDLSFFRYLRPLHVTLSIGWIFLAYMAALHYFIPQVCKTDWKSPGLAKLQLILMATAGLAAPVSYLFGKFSGREYVAFVPAISAIIYAAWIAFLVNFFMTVRSLPRPWPVYLWMWATGLVLFALTFAEAHFWLIPGVRDNIARDLTVQWKSYGALIGSWNHVVYGLSIYMAARITGDDSVGREKLAYGFFWLGLFNLMFGWAHHTYQIPQSQAIRVFAFATSMTEWAILAHLLWTWTSRASAGGVPGLFLRSANVWVGINLCLALLISIPPLNALTHGTPVTIAHAMGTTIGINTMILLSCVSAILVERSPLSAGQARFFRAAVPWVNASLAGMFITLLAAGGVKGKAMLIDGASFYTAMESMRPWMQAFSISGIALGLGLFAIASHMLVMMRVKDRSPVEWTTPGRLFPKPAYALAVFGLSTIPWWIPRPAAPEPLLMSIYPGGESELARHGREIFLREACWKCHGSPTAMNAPDLTREGPAWSEGWHAAHLFDPRLCRSRSTMPSYAHLLENDDASALIAYLVQLQQKRARELSASLDHGLVGMTGGDPRRGSGLYQQHCASCHGVTGGGDGPAVRFFTRESMPRDLTRGRFRNRSTTDAPTDEDLWLTITHGMPGSAMAGFKELTAQDRYDLVAYVRALSSRPSDAKPVAVPRAPERTEALVRRGELLLRDARCFQCHGGDLKGLQASDHGFEWLDEAGRPVPRSTDLRSGVFKSGSSDARLYRTLFYGRGGSPMPCYFEAFPSEEDRWAMVHYLRSLWERPE